MELIMGTTATLLTLSGIKCKRYCLPLALAVGRAVFFATVLSGRDVNNMCEKKDMLHTGIGRKAEKAEGGP
jgi:hypothetical protein